MKLQMPRTYLLNSVCTVLAAQLLYPPQIRGCSPSFMLFEPEWGFPCGRKHFACQSKPHRFHSFRCLFSESETQYAADFAHISRQFLERTRLWRGNIIKFGCMETRHKEVLETSFDWRIGRKADGNWNIRIERNDCIPNLNLITNITGYYHSGIWPLNSFMSLPIIHALQSHLARQHLDLTVGNHLLFKSKHSLT